MSVTNPAPSQIADGNWSLESGIRSFTVSIPTKPSDNDLAGIIVLAKAGSGQTLTFPDNVFYRGPWSDLILISTDENNNVLLPNQAYTVKVAAFDEFGTDSLTFSDAKEVVTLQVVTDDIKDEAVTNGKIPDNEIESAKISGLVADKITAGTITGSTLQTSSTGSRFVVSVDDEARFYDQDVNSEYTQIASIGAYNTASIYSWPNNSTGDTNVILSGGAQIKTTESGTGFYGIEFISTGTAKLFVDDLIPGESYDVGYVSDCGSGLTIDMGGTAIPATLPAGTAIVTCEQPYILITNSGTITSGEYIYFSISRKDRDAIIYSGGKTSNKNAFYGVSYNISSFKAYSYGSTNVNTAEFRNNGSESGVSVLGYIARTGSSTSVLQGGFFQATRTGYSGTFALGATVGVYGYVSGVGGTGVLGRATKSFTDNTLQDDCAAFRSIDGDCDFRESIVYFKTYTVSTLPSASIAGGMIYVSDESGGAVMAFSDGTNWRRMTDRAIVS